MALSNGLSAAHPMALLFSDLIEQSACSPSSLMIANVSPNGWIEMEIPTAIGPLWR
jgi:hypothetical protein